jgi:DNA excision repair protein ERCC-2
VALIRACIGIKKGNYLCFFPSYAYMQMAVAVAEKQNWPGNLLVQTREMGDDERSRFLERFSEHNPDTLVGFAVMGGIFGEGIDLVGDRLSGAVIVGVGLPAICHERELIRDHFETRGSGFDYAYRYPGINRVLQAGGRVIRTGQDRGVLVLVDQRFCFSDYRNLLPMHWAGTTVYSRQQLEKQLKGFWINQGAQ